MVMPFGTRQSAAAAVARLFFIFHLNCSVLCEEPQEGDTGSCAWLVVVLGVLVRTSTSSTSEWCTVVVVVAAAHMEWAAGSYDYKEKSRSASLSM